MLKQEDPPSLTCQVTYQVPAGGTVKNSIRFYLEGMCIVSLNHAMYPHVLTKPLTINPASCLALCVRGKVEAHWQPFPHTQMLRNGNRGWLGVQREGAYNVHCGGVYLGQKWNGSRTCPWCHSGQRLAVFPESMSMLDRGLVFVWHV